MYTIVSLFRGMASGVMGLVQMSELMLHAGKIQQGFIDCPEAPNDFCIGDVMRDRQHREAYAPFSGSTAWAQRQTDAVEPTMQYEGPGQDREEDWRRSLHSLQECICELLIRNQELRMSLLDSATNQKSAETDQ